jgi:hypothetical protein
MNAMTPSLPNLIIAGVNKAATTSLYTYLSRHSAVCCSSIKETNYFMPLAAGDVLAPIDNYAAYFDDCCDRRYRMEASPRYIFGGARLAEGIRERLGPIRIVFVLRDPVDRLISYFKHMKRSREVHAELSCEEYAGHALEELPAALGRANGRPVNVYRESVFVRGLAQGFYADYLEEWYAVFPDSIRIYFFEDLTGKPGHVMNDLCSWLDIDRSVYEDAEFTWENRSIKHRNQLVYRAGQFINQTCEPFWRRHSRAKELARELYCLLNEKRGASGDLSGAGRLELERVYGPYNRKLLKLLAANGYQHLPDWVGR